MIGDDDADWGRSLSGMTLSRKLQHVVTLAAAAAFVAVSAVFIFHPPAVSGETLIALGTLLALGLFSTLLDFRITESGATTSVDFIPLLGAILLIGPAHAVVVTAVLFLFRHFLSLRKRERKPFHKWLFNTAQRLLAVSAAGFVFLWFGGQPSLTAIEFRTTFPPFLLGVVAYFLVNACAVVYVISISEEKPFVSVWRNVAGHLIVFDVAISPLAYLFALFYILWGAPTVLLAIMPLIGLRYSYGVNVELQQLNHDLLRVLVKTIEARDPYTSGHSLRVSERSRRIAEQLGLPRKLVDLIETGALLHDIGKIDMAYSEILRQAGPLTPEQRELIRAHPDKGVDIVSSIRSMDKRVLECIRHHHEWVDGSGYPVGLSGRAIPIGARIIMVSDSIDAMATDRPYRAALDADQIRRELRDNASTQFDPDVVKAALEAGILEDLREHQEKRNEQPTLAARKIGGV